MKLRYFVGTRVVLRARGLGRCTFCIIHKKVCAKFITYIGPLIALFGPNSENWEYLNYTASVIPSVRHTSLAK